MSLILPPPVSPNPAQQSPTPEMILASTELSPEERLRLIFGEKFTFHGGSESWYRDRTLHLTQKTIVPQKVMVNQNHQQSFIYTNGLPGSHLEKIKKIQFNTKKYEFEILVANERGDHLTYRILPFVHPDVGSPDYLVTYRKGKDKKKNHLTLFYLNSKRNHQMIRVKKTKGDDDSSSEFDDYDRFIKFHGHVLQEDIKLQKRKVKNVKQPVAQPVQPTRTNKRVQRPLAHPTQPASQPVQPTRTCRQAKRPIAQPTRPASRPVQPTHASRQARRPASQPTLKKTNLRTENPPKSRVPRKNHVGTIDTHIPGVVGGPVVPRHVQKEKRHHQKERKK